MTEMSLKTGDTLSWRITIPAGQGIDTLDGLVPACDLRGTSGVLRLTSVVISAADRVVGVSASATQTAGLRPGSYRFDLQLTSPGGYVSSSVTKRCQVAQDVTSV